MYPVQHLDEYDGDDLLLLATAYPATRCYSPDLFRALIDLAMQAPDRYGSLRLMELAKVSGPAGAV